jgi:hypothetical protein
MKACLPNPKDLPCYTASWDVKPKPLRRLKPEEQTHRAKPVLPPPSR